MREEEARNLKSTSELKKRMEEQYQLQLSQALHQERERYSGTIIFVTDVYLPKRRLIISTFFLYNRDACSC